MPAEHLILNMLIVLFVQGFANSASRHAVVLGWIISITCSNLSISYIGSHLYFWINVQYLMLLCVSYEFERHTLRHFVKVRWLKSFLPSFLYSSAFFPPSLASYFPSFLGFLPFFLAFFLLSLLGSLPTFLTLLCLHFFYQTHLLFLKILPPPLSLYTHLSLSISISISLSSSFYLFFTQSMLAVDISESNSCLSLALANQRITEGEVALSSKRSVVSQVLRIR